MNEQDHLIDGLAPHLFINHIWLEYLLKCPQHLLYRERPLEVLSLYYWPAQPGNPWD